jgi:hypothetical protein
MSAASAPAANAGISSNGMMLAGRGFVLSSAEAHYLRERSSAENPIILPYLNGGELVKHQQRRFVIDAFSVVGNCAAPGHPAIYQYLLEMVKPERDKNRRPAFRRRWWYSANPENISTSACRFASIYRDHRNV